MEAQNIGHVPALEEPLPQSGYLGYPELRAKLELPLAGGESLTTRPAAYASLQRGCFDIIQPDATLCGGIGECLFVAEMARLWSMQCNPHCWGGAIAIAATVQVLALLPVETWSRTTEAPMLELDVYENPFRDKLIKRPIQVRDGLVDVPSGPGLGIEVDEDVVKHYECK